MISLWRQDPAATEITIQPSFVVHLKSISLLKENSTYVWRYFLKYLKNVSRNYYILLNSVWLSNAIWHRSGSTLPLVPDGTKPLHETINLSSMDWRGMHLWAISPEVLKNSMRIVHKKITLYRDVAIFLLITTSYPAKNINIPHITVINNIPNWLNGTSFTTSMKGNLFTEEQKGAFVMVSTIDIIAHGRQNHSYFHSCIFNIDIDVVNLNMDIIPYVSEFQLIILYASWVSNHRNSHKGSSLLT